MNIQYCDKCKQKIDIGPKYSERQYFLYTPFGDIEVPVDLCVSCQFKFNKMMDEWLNKTNESDDDIDDIDDIEKICANCKYVYKCQMCDSTITAQCCRSFVRR